MQTNNLKTTHQALLDVASSEYKYLTESKEHDGFELSKLEILDGTDEELHITFSLQLNGKTANFKYSLGFDVDENAYMPYVEVEAGDEKDPIAFSIKTVGDHAYVDESALSESIEQLDRNCGEARYEVFEWLKQHA